MVLEVGVQLRLAVLPRAQQPPLGVARLVEQEARRAGRGVHVVVAFEHGAGLRERRDHERVPGGEPLVVEARPDALRARLVEERAPARQPLRRAGPAHRDVAALEVAAVGGAEPGDRLVGVGLARERLAHLLDAPDVELALDALRVRVEGGEEAALGAAHLAQRPVERLLAYRAEQRLAGHLPAVQVRAREQGVVVEHLLEVGDEPVGVHRVAREAAAHLVVHAARGHRAQRLGGHVRLAAAQQELEGRGGRELRGAAEAAVRHVVLGPERAHRLVESARVHGLRRRAQAARRRAAARPRARRRRGSRPSSPASRAPPPRAPGARPACPCAASGGK